MLTRKLPRFTTMHSKVASLPIGTVRLVMGSPNSGTSIPPDNKQKNIIKLQKYLKEILESLMNLFIGFQT